MHHTRGRTPVGRVVSLWRYPVKSMAAEALDEVEVSWQGLTGDRRWAFVRNEVPDSGFPWLTLRQRADLNLYRPSLLEPARPDRSTTMVQTPSNETLEVTDPALATELWSKGTRVVRHDRGLFDAFPLSLITTQTIDRLAKDVGMPLDPLRFRPNLLIEAVQPEPFQEDLWVGQLLHIGDFTLRVDKRDGRCLVITLDPKTGARSPEILRNVAQQRQGCLGVYGSTVEPGQIAVGDPVSVG